jgi:TRAP-type C4-dicarboxylate transport system substrate-binding protein
MDAAQETIPVQQKLWADYVGEAVTQLKAKGMKFNEVDNIADFQAKAKPVYKKYESTVGAELIQAIVNAGK